MCPRSPSRSADRLGSSTSTRPVGSSATCGPSCRCAPGARSPTPSSRGSTISTPSETVSTTRRSGRNVLLVAAVVGIALGVFSILADGILPGRLFTLLGNIAAPWALGAFVVGFRATSPRQGAVAGALALVVGVATYYAGGR